MTITKRGKLTILAALVVIVVLLLGVTILRKPKNADALPTGVSTQGVAPTADYHLIPILNAQSNDNKQVYLNTAVTPALFFATWSSESQKDISAIQDKLSKIGPVKPLVLVSTFTNTTDQAKAIDEAKTFAKTNKVQLPVTVQVGPPTEFVTQLPALVYTDDKGTHIITDENKILDSMKTVLAMPVSQQPQQQSKSEKK